MRVWKRLWAFCELVEYENRAANALSMPMASEGVVGILRMTGLSFHSTSSDCRKVGVGGRDRHVLGKAEGHVLPLTSSPSHTDMWVGVIPWLWMAHQGHGADAGSPPVRGRKTSRLSLPILQQDKMRPQEPCQPLSDILG